MRWLSASMCVLCLACDPGEAPAVPIIDAGADAGAVTEDAGATALDAGPSDGGAEDAGLDDAGRPDAGSSDAGSCPTPLRLLGVRAEQDVKGVVPLAVELDTCLGTPSQVAIVVGERVFPATRDGQTRVWRAPAWDTRVKLEAPDAGSPSNHLAWIRAEATAAGTTHRTALLPVFTANYDYGPLPDGGWRPELAWAADYSGTKADWLAGFAGPVPGSAYASLVADPIRGASRKVIKVSLPDSAKNDADQPTGSPRFQAQQPTTPSTKGFFEGDEFCVGFAVLVPASSSAAVGGGGFPSVNVSRTNTEQHIAIFQMYGPQASSPTDYPSGRGAITILDANRRVASDPIDRFHIEANQLNGGDPGLVVEFPYNRGQWTDVVLCMHMSASIKRGWLEVWLNQGQSTTVQPVPLIGGKLRLPRVTAWPETSTPAVPPSLVNGTLVQGGSRRHRTDMQIYRSPTAYDEVTLFHTAHRVGPTPASVDPRSYAP